MDISIPVFKSHSLVPRIKQPKQHVIECRGKRDFLEQRQVNGMGRQTLSNKDMTERKEIRQKQRERQKRGNC